MFTLGENSTYTCKCFIKSTPALLETLQNQLNIEQSRPIFEPRPNHTVVVYLSSSFYFGWFIYVKKCLEGVILKYYVAGVGPQK